MNTDGDLNVDLAVRKWRGGHGALFCLRAAPYSTVNQASLLMIHSCAGSLWKCQTRCPPAMTFR